jgi:hypothetical protein
VGGRRPCGNGHGAVSLLCFRRYRRRVYGTAIGSALKWFPDHRGLAAGLTAAGFGAGSAFTVSPIANLIKTAGYQTAFIQWGIIQGAVVVIAALFLHAPPAGWLPGHWTYGIFLTVVPTAWTPFAAKFTLPKIGWAGVFTIAIVFDTVAAVLAWFVLRRMKLPSHVPHVSYAPHPKVAVAAGLER